jgi:pyrimidine operon attenuation protein / uracil phosphoribosyltransferase
MDPDTSPEGEVVMTAAQIRRALRRMANQVLEWHGGVERLVIIGIRTRGTPLAERLATIINEIEGARPQTGAVDVTFYRDDFVTRAKSPDETTDLPFSVDGTDVLLVDDVLSTGRTVRAAIDTLMDFGRPAAIQLAALIDRGHRELPVMANYVGRTIQTQPKDVVRVHLDEIDGEDFALHIKNAEDA